MIAKALRLIRQFHDLDRSQTADRLGISKEFLLALETGKKPINRDILIKYSEAFDIPLSSLTFFIIDSKNLLKEQKFSKRAKGKMAGKILQIMEWIVKKNGVTQNKFKA